MFEQWLDVRQNVGGDDLVAFVSGVGVIGLHHALHAVDVVEQEGQHGHFVLTGQRGVVAGEALDVVRAVVGRQRDAGEDDLDACRLEGLDHAGEVGAGGFDIEAAQAVVAAELKHDYRRVQGGDVGDAVDTILGGVAGDAFVDDAVEIAVTVEVFLEEVGVAGAFVGTEAGGERVAEADDERAWVNGGGLAGGDDVGCGRGFFRALDCGCAFVHLRRGFGGGIGFASDGTG